AQPVAQCGIHARTAPRVGNENRFASSEMDAGGRRLFYANRDRVDSEESARRAGAIASTWIRIPFSSLARRRQGTLRAISAPGRRLKSKPASTCGYLLIASPARTHQMFTRLSAARTIGALSGMLNAFANSG